MKTIKLLLPIVIIGVLIASCSVNQDGTRNYGNSSTLSTSDFVLTSHGSFSYKLRGEGLGRKEWSYGTWSEISKNKILLYSIRHDSLPIRVKAEKQDIEGKIIVLPKDDEIWRLDVTIFVNDQPIRVPEDQRMLFLSSKDFPEIKTISIEADIRNEDIISELVNFYKIKTVSYNVQDTSSNIFYVTFPFPDASLRLLSGFSLKELQDTIIVKKKKLIWRGYKYYYKGYPRSFPPIRPR